MLDKEKIQKALIYCCAIVPGFLAITWIITFGFTNYRQHLAYIGLPLGVAMGVLSIGMIFLKRRAVIVSIALTILTMVASIAIFYLSQSPLYPAIIIVGSI
ncbi:MAG TPA: hypothetical protein VF893_00270 [Candidatus Bathyarchaeia archaeon]